MIDPISDMLTRMRNAQMVGKTRVSVASSKMKTAIAKVLQEEGYIERFEVIEKFREKPGSSAKSKNKFPELTIYLKYYAGRPVIEKISRESRPGLRKFSGSKELPRPSNGLGLAIISTSQGVMSSTTASKANLGGEVLFTVY